MGFLKGFATFILGFLFFLVLTAFSVVFMLQSTLLSPDFVKQQVDRLDVSAVVRDIAGDQISEGLPQEMAFLEDAIFNIIDEEEPWLKEQAGRAIDDGYAYLLGETDSLSITIPLADLKAELKETLWQEMSQEFNTMLGDSLQTELRPFVEQNLPAFRQLLPPEYQSVPDAELEPYIDVILQEIQDEITVMGESGAITELVETLARPFYDDYYDEFIAEIPDDFVIDEASIPADVMQPLEMARQYIGYLRSGFYWLLAIMVVLAAAIFLVHRNIQDPSRALGIDLAVYGALDLAGTLVARSFLPTAYMMDVPDSLHAWVTGIYNDITGVMLWFSIGVLVAGAALIVVSFIFKKKTAEA